jgi:hypothetical protein
VVVSTDIDATTDEVWAAVESIERHVEWMADAESIEFESAQRRGAGTRFRCLTRVGPFRLADEMEVTDWQPGRTMGVRHVGIVTGTGAFTLSPLDLGRRTRFTWREQLRFPWWLGGPVGSAAGAATVFPILWRRNLGRLRDLVEANR